MCSRAWSDHQVGVLLGVDALAHRAQGAHQCRLGLPVIGLEPHDGHARGAEQGAQDAVALGAGDLLLVAHERQTPGLEPLHDRSSVRDVDHRRLVHYNIGTAEIITQVRALQDALDRVGHDVRDRGEPLRRAPRGRTQQRELAGDDHVADRRGLAAARTALNDHEPVAAEDARGQHLLARELVRGRARGAHLSSA